jgi:SM-20-related protein
MSNEQIARTLGEQGWVVVPDFLNNEEVADLTAGLMQEWHAGRLRPAGVGHGTGRQVRQDIRGDRILWLDEAAATPAQQTYLSRMDALRTAINQETFLGLFDLESHFAIYPADSFYRKHLDRFRDDSARTVSCILYLNRDWSPHDGGQLRLYLEPGPQGEGDYIDVAPAVGTLVVFLSDRFWHEVLPTRRERMSLTGWFRTRA